MQILVNTDNTIEGRDALAAHVTTVVEKTLKKVGDRVTRVEVHLSDEKGGGGVEDKRCTMEARVERIQPTAVSHHAPTLSQAIDGAAEKLARSLTTVIGKMRHNR